VSNELLFLLIGLVLLWLPRGWLRLGKPTATRKRRPNRDEEVERQRQPSDHSLWIGDEFSRIRNWLDLFRGMAGAFAVVTTLPELITQLLAVTGASGDQLALGLFGGIFVAATTIQMIRMEERLSLTPPIFFLAGVSFAVVGPQTALIAFVAIWAINTALPNPSIFMSVYATMVIILGIVLGAGKMETLLMSGLLIFPPFIAILFKRRLAQFKKRSKVVAR
jgi:hypothetical protein